MCTLENEFRRLSRASLLLPLNSATSCSPISDNHGSLKQDTPPESSCKPDFDVSALMRAKQTAFLLPTLDILEQLSQLTLAVPAETHHES
ncbi:unnamed protein product, partial [Protopolystoma xenopodis]